MLKAYKPIKHKIFDAHKLLEYLVVHVWCEADNQRCKTKLNTELKAIYEDTRIQPKSFKNPVRKIYSICKKLSAKDKEEFKQAFIINNQIEDLCKNPSKRIPLSSLNQDLMKEVIPFLKTLYKSFLGWKLIGDTYGSKKEYYDDLIKSNDFSFCPCCGYGQIKTIYDKGHSAFDHYLSLKYYPFSVVNFLNLIPLCDECNSDNKSESDILSAGKKVFYPISTSHPEIKVDYDISSSSFKEIVIKINSPDKLDKKHIVVKFNLIGDEVESWDSIFKIKGRYFGQVASNRGNWLGDVREAFRNVRINTPTLADAFDHVIDSDANKYQGFLKSPYLEKMKTFTSLFEAIKEVSGNYRIN